MIHFSELNLPGTLVEHSCKTHVKQLADQDFYKVLDLWKEYLNFLVMLVKNSVYGVRRFSITATYV